MTDGSAILYLGRVPSIAVHNAVFDGISRYAAMRGWTAESVDYRVAHGKGLSVILAEKRPWNAPTGRRTSLPPPSGASRRCS